MGELRFDDGLLAEVAHRLDLREPNRKAIESVALRVTDHFDGQESPPPFEYIVDSATGVGKTYVMAGLIEYFAGTDTPARNFLLLAPGRTIRDKSIKNFTPGNAKSLTPAMKSRPFVVTSENFNSPTTVKTMRDSSITKLYVFTVQALTSATGDGRATHEYQEYLGGSFYEFLKGLDDLVVLADEHHCYRGPAFSKTITDLHPSVVVGFTATPDKRDELLVVYRYPLAAAIADKLVKTPVIVGRRDDKSDPTTKLLDGVSLLRLKEQTLVGYCDENDLPFIHPIMLVIAKDIAEAGEFRDILDSVDFDGGAWLNTTLLVHSALTGDDKEKALADLEVVETPGATTRIIISVGMLKEGWDVKNVYVIASMRASVSEVLTEQTLGRGMRLPFGKYTGIELLDTVEVLAHEKYNDLLAKRKVLNESFIDFGTYEETRKRDDGQVVVRPVVTTPETPVIANPVDEPVAEPTGEPGDTEPSTGGVVDLDTRIVAAVQAANATPQKVDYSPIAGRADIVIPYIEPILVPAAVSLNDIDESAYPVFDALGQAFATDYVDELKRTKITGERHGDRVIAGVEEAASIKQQRLVLDHPLSESRKMLLTYIRGVSGVQDRPAEINRAGIIVDRVIAAMGDDAAATLSAFGERCGQRLATEIGRQLKQASAAQVTYSDEVRLANLDKIRTTNKRPVAGHADGGFATSTAFNGWDKNLYTHAWFDSLPEYKTAAAIDANGKVIVWARLHRNDIPIKWTAEGREYNPDFVVIENDNGKTIGWLVETKADRDIDNAEVAAKRRAALKWSRTVNTTDGVDTEWRYLLLLEQDVDDAGKSWDRLKEFGR